MVWPLLPLVVENQLKPALIVSALATTLASVTGCGFFSPLAGISTLCGFGFFCRILRTVSGPSTCPRGFCSREEHTRRLRAAEAVAKQPGPLRMFKSTTSNTFRPQQIGARETKSRLDLSGFVHVLEVNTTELWCDIEASATFETFVDATFSQGTAPLVVPELRTITVGGAIVGIGVESSSFRHGFFHEGLVEADILLASGEVATVSPNEHEDLFRALPNSLGSFGYLLRLRMKIQPVEPLVRLQKVWYGSVDSLIEGLQKACSEDYAFVDAVALSEEGGMVMTGKFVAKVPEGEHVTKYGVWPMFYPTLVHEGTEFLHTIDYLWRWDSDWFWCTQIFPGLSWRAVRWLCGRETLRSDVYKAFNDSIIKNVLQPLGLNKNEELVIQDIDLPVEKSAEWIRNFLGVVPSGRIGKIKLSRPGSKRTVPIWLCPVRGTGSPLMPMREGHLYINFGFWDALEGPETVGGLAAGRVNRALEDLCTELGGKKTLYSSAFFSEEAFYDLYNGEYYKKIKERYDPNMRFRGWYERLMRS